MFGRVEVDQNSLRLLVSALRKEADGRALQRDLITNLRRVAQPAAAAAKASILSMGAHDTADPPLRTAIASRVKVRVRTTGRRPGVAIRVAKTPEIRGFKNAPQRLNRKRGWEHPLFGSWEHKVHQMGKPGWFDLTLQPFKVPARKAAKEAMDRVAKRISQRTRG